MDRSGLAWSIDFRNGVIHDRVEPAASPAMPTMPQQAEVSSKHYPHRDGPLQLMTPLRIRAALAARRVDELAFKIG